jgi:cytochrome c-type biogenesis protein CcmH
MIQFWMAAAALAAGASALMLRGAQASRVAGAPADPALVVYRRALGEIDELAQRGVLAQSDRASLRAESARRLLGATDQTAPALRAGGPAGPLAAIALVIVTALAAYLAVGEPGMPDQPFAARLASWRAHPETASPAALAATLTAIARQRPADPEPLRRLAYLDLALGDADGAIHALRGAMARGETKLSPVLGEVLTLKAGGAPDPEARELFARTLQSNPADPTARYYLARTRIAQGDVVGGVAGWRSLAAALPTGDARRAALEGEIAEVEKTGKLPVVQRAPPPDMAADIRGMVEGLAARLRAHPDDPDGWVRLVRAYRVLGEDDKSRAALAAARARYARSPQVLAQLAAAGR